MSQSGSSPPRPRASILYLFPFIAIAALIYVGVVQSYGPAAIAHKLDERMFELAIAPGETTVFLARDAFLLLIFVLLACEVWKAAIFEVRAVVNHMLSLVVVLGCFFALFRLQGYDTPTFLFIVVAAVFDVVVGLYVTLRARPLNERPIRLEVRQRRLH